MGIREKTLEPIALVLSFTFIACVSGQAPDRMGQKQCIQLQERDEKNAVAEHQSVKTEESLLMRAWMAERSMVRVSFAGREWVSTRFDSLALPYEPV